MIPSWLTEIREIIPISWPHRNSPFWVEVEEMLKAFQLTEPEARQIKSHLFSRPITWPHELAPRLRSEIEGIRQRSTAPRPIEPPPLPNDDALIDQHWDQLDEADRLYWIGWVRTNFPHVAAKADNPLSARLWSAIADSMARTNAYDFARGIDVSPKRQPEDLCPTQPSDSNDLKPYAAR